MTLTFDLMLKEITSNPDMQNHLSNLGFTEKEEIQFFSVRGYNQTIRRKYCNKVQIKMLGEDYVPLGYEQYFQSYKEYITKTENVFERFYFLCQLQELDSFDYFSLVTDTIKSCINGNEDSGNSSNLIKFQTEEVRNRLLFLLEEMAKRNGDNVKESNKLKLDAKIYKLNNDISIYNAIISNLKRMEKALRSNKESSPEEYTTIVSFIEAYSNLREKIQEEYSKVRRYLEFNDPLSKRSADNPLIALYELERKNVLISDIIPKRNKKTGRCYLQIDLVKIDREKNIENFNSFQQRRDYFGPKEFFDVISMETGVDIKISYTYCYPEGSRILNYEERLNKIFTNKGLSNTNMKAPDYFYIHKIENRLSLEEYMTRLNKTILG